MSGSDASVVSAASVSPRIFVSHSDEDDIFCQRLIADLRAQLGEDAVWDDTSGGPHGGDSWWDRIVAEITARPFFLAALSPHADASSWVGQEMRIAFHQHVKPGKRLLPVRIAPSPRPADWDGIREFDFLAHNQQDRYEAALAELLRALGADPDAQPAVSTLPPAPLITPRERLARLGFATEMGTDPRTGKEVTFMRPPLCSVPAGPSQMGSDTKQDSHSFPDELPQITVELPAYQIGKFPVTVAEYACFVAAGHAAPQKGYVGTDWSVQLKRLDCPVTCVTWYDARDYAMWLAALTGQPWELPSEAEWEKAARWDATENNGHGHARIYPWGDRFDGTRCNTSESTPTIGMTTPVGTYGPEHPTRDGSSPCGAQDMAGNVWEWTRTIYDAHAYSNGIFKEDENSTENRVLRGGSWFNDARDARAAYRNDDLNPDNFSDNWGFRLVVRA